MSYDLYLHRRAGAGPLTKEAFLAYFTGDPHVTLTDNHAHYENKKTGVYFTFQYSEVVAGDADETAGARIYFNMNYFRPHVFGLEAERVLSRLVKKLDLLVSDPQAEGMGEGEYTPEGFLRGWNAGNRFGYQAYLSLEPRGEQLLTQRHTLPAKTLRAGWEWTYGIDALYDDVHADDIDVFIPQVMFVLCDGVLQTLCVWPQLIPTALPAVDRVLVMRDQLPPHLAEGADPSRALVSWAEVRAAAAEFELVTARGNRGLEYVLMGYGTAEDAPAELADFVRALPPFDGTLQILATDQILDEELVRECAPKAE